mmetsp:Transcript_33000/g.60493  ORF Transcript_33000/g.60493 Transcript_33000/m.60493 type:complete len:261 (-) Transcript_33000:15-797(-)
MKCIQLYLKQNRTPNQLILFVHVALCFQLIAIDIYKAYTIRRFSAVISLVTMHHVVAIRSHFQSILVLHKALIVFLLIREVHREANTLHRLRNRPLFCHQRLSHRLLKHHPRQLSIHNRQEGAYRRHHNMIVRVARLDMMYVGKKMLNSCCNRTGLPNCLTTSAQLGTIAIDVILLLQIVRDRGYEDRIEVDEDEVRNEGGITQPAREQSFTAISAMVMTMPGFACPTSSMALEGIGATFVGEFFSPFSASAMIGCRSHL